MAHSSLGEMFKSTCERYPQKTGVMVKENGSYREILFEELFRRMQEIAAGLHSLDAKKGDRVLLLSENRVEWALSDYAILSLGAITVPIYPTLLPNQIEYLVNNCEGHTLIVSNLDQFAKIAEIRNKISLVRNIILMEGEPGSGTVSWDELLHLGDEALKENPALVDNCLRDVTREDVASIIYTSGTTALPKGVVLTHGNFLSNVEAAAEVIQVYPEDIFLSFLPLSHSFERMAGHFLANYCGCVIAYAESLETVAQNTLEVRPTLMAGVPRFFEKVYGRVLDSVEESSRLKRKIFFWAIEVGKESNSYAQRGKPLHGFLKFKHDLADKLVYSKLKQRVGGRIRLFVSGGAPLSREIAEFFTAAGLTLLEGYGLTEASPVITVNHPDNFRFACGGLPLSNVEVIIADDGEILSRGPHIMPGYYKNDEATRESIDEQGWLHTGDIGYIDEDGFLYITDRKKNIIVTSGGKNIAPQPIENLLNGSRYIEQSVVIGDNRRFCTALIVPNMDHLSTFAEKQKLPYADEEALLRLPEIIRLIRSEIDAVTVNLPRYESIKKFHLLKDPFTIENGEITPTLKIKRKVLEAKYKEVIDAMYSEGEAGFE